MIEILAAVTGASLSWAAMGSMGDQAALKASKKLWCG
jgi:hypothetical protein